MKSYFSILALSIIVTTTKCSQWEKWKNYIDSTLFNSFQSMPRDISIKNFLDIFLYRKTLGLKEMININFVNTTEVKSIIGSIICCPLFKLVIKIHTRWIFKGAKGLQFNVTFTYFNVGRYKERMRYSDVDELDEYLKYGLDLLHKRYPRAIIYTGRRNRMEFFTSLNHIYFESYTFFSVDIKLFIIFSVMSGIIEEQNIHDNYNINRNTLNIWQSSTNTYYIYPRLCYHTYNILRSKLYPLALRFSEDNIPALLRLYDGPDSSAELIPLKGNYVELSTFQCYLGVTISEQMGFGKCFVYEKMNFTIHLISLKFKSNSYINLVISEVTAPQTITLSQSKNRQIIYSVYNISARNMYLNVSLRTMRFSGPNINNCMFGGVAYIDIFHNLNNESFSFKKKKRNEEIKQLCDNFTTRPRKGSFAKISTDYISSGSEMFIVVYGYHPSYVGMEVNIMVSVVPCKGLIPCQKAVVPCKGFIPCQKGMSVFVKSFLTHDRPCYL